MLSIEILAIFADDILQVRKQVTNFPKAVALFGQSASNHCLPRICEVLFITLTVNFSDDFGSEL